MTVSVRDWQLHGVELKVELATSGELVLGGRETMYPFLPGGPTGAPLGWQTRYASTVPNPYPSDYTYTTQSGVASVSRSSTPHPTYAGMIKDDFVIVPGKRYQVGVQARQLAGKDPSRRSISVYMTKDNGVNWIAMVPGGAATAQNDWEQFTGNSSGPIPDGYTRAYVGLDGVPQSGSALWGVQFQNLYFMELADEPEPLVWHDITCDVRAIGLRHGRERFTNRYDLATLEIELQNDRGDYTYQRIHPLGLRPGRQVKVTATYEGVTYPMAFMVLDSIREGYSLDGHVLSNWQCVDPTSTLSNAEVRSSGIFNPKSGTRINALLDQVGYWSRQLDPGVFVQKPIIASGRTIRDEAGVSADSEGSSFFAERDGRIIYKDRDWLLTDPLLMKVNADLMAMPHQDDLPVVDDIPNADYCPKICLSELLTDWSLNRVINMVSLANAGGTAKDYVNIESVKAHGPHTYQRMDFVNADYTGAPYNTYLDTRANDLMTGYSDPLLRVNQITYQPGIDGEWEFALSVFLNWLVRIWYRNEANDWGYAVCVHIQSIEHRITPRDWSISMAVDAPSSFIEIEDSKYGWDMGLWDEALWDQTAPAGALWSDPDSTWSTPGDNWGE